MKLYDLFISEEGISIRLQMILWTKNNVGNNRSSTWFKLVNVLVTC